MNILMGNNTLSLLAGTETWTETLAKQFKKMGHSVTVYSPELGYIAMRLEADGIRCINSLESADGVKPFDFRLEQDTEKNFDLIVCNHHDISLALRRAHPHVPMIVTVHGIIHKGENGEIYPEHPAMGLSGAKFVAVGEEVRDLLRKEYGIEAGIIRNFLDLDRFSLPEGSVARNKKPTVFAINSNYLTLESPELLVARDVAKHYGGDLRCVGAGFGTQVYEMEELLSDVDVVFGQGRSVLEGLSLGKVAISHGRFGTGGVITPETYPDIVHFNFSGRNSGQKLAEPADIVAEIDKVYGSNEHLKWCRQICEENHNVEEAARAYLSLWLKEGGL